MASFHDSSTLNLRYQVGSGTDIGGGRENQDESFVWINKEANLIVLGVLDGHGREVGKIAAQAGKQRIVQYLDTDFSFLQTSPVQFLVHAHELAHEHIRATFQAELERQGYQVQLTEEGYLMKRRSTADYWSCVHGGTSCSLVALVGNALYIANVGDSTAIMCSSHPILQKNILHFEVDSAMPIHEGAPSSGSTIRDSALHDSTAPESPVSDARKVLVLTAEHSPESPYEFDRLRRYRPRDNDELQPALFVVYDSPNHDKSHCQPVFDPTTPTLQPSQRGSYYKNVRKEWASLVSTPVTAKFQDALAFTRSLGDLHLHTYGVTHLPEVHRVELAPIFQSLSQQAAAAAAAATANTADATTSVSSATSNSTTTPSAEQIANSTICVVVASDGVWDNWIYEDVGRFMMDASCLNATATHVEGAQKVMTSFMIRNSQFSKRNFGNQADNATGIVFYLSLSSNFSA